jgi:hypothetical protein
VIGVGGVVGLGVVWDGSFGITPSLT